MKTQTKKIKSKLKLKLKSMIALLLCFLMLSDIISTISNSGMIVQAATSSLNLQLTLNSNGSITSSWSPVSGAVKYTILIYDSKNNCYANERNLTTTSYTSIANLSHNEQYSVTLAAYDSSSVCIVSEGKTLLIPYGFYDTTLPATPMNVGATSTTNSVKVSWDAVSNATSYDVVFNGTTYNVTGTSKEFTGLSSNTTYVYTVRANNANGSSSYSDVKQITTAPAVLLVPTNLTATAAATYALVGWDEVAGATGYDVFFDGTVYSTTGTVWAFNGLSPNTVYTFSVRAKNASTTSAYSTAKTFMTLPTPPAVPTNLTAASTTTSVAVSWDAVSGATSYNLMFDGTVYNVTGTAKSFTGLPANTAYTYSVCANNAGGSGAYTNSQVIKTAPNIPTGIVSIVDTDYVLVGWDAVSGATGYDVLFNGTVYSVNATAKLFSGLTANTNYAFSVRAKNDYSASAYSSTYIARTLPNRPDVPANVTATSTANSATVSWSAVTGADRYELIFDGTAYSVTGTSKTITGLSMGMSYNYAVCAINDGGTSAYSTTKTVTTTYTKPDVPSIITATTTSNSVTVSWVAVNGATTYDILFNGTTYNLAGTSKTFTGLYASTPHEYAVRAKNSAGTSAYSTTRTATTLPLPPGTPSNVSATATTTSITITWSSVSFATGYDVLFDGISYSVTGTTKTFTGLNPGTSHTYSVRAKNTGGSSAYSTTKTITTTPVPPTEVPVVSAFTTENAVTLSWDPISGATSYKVTFNGKEYTTSDTSITFSDLSPNTGNTYAVRASNSAGSSPYSDTKTITTTPNPPSGNNINITATENSVTLSWEPVPGATSYDVKFNGTEYNTTDTSMTFNDLPPDTGNTYSVRTNNADGSSSYSTSKTVKTTLNPPTNVRATAVEDSVTVSWDKVDRATGYEILFYEAEFTAYSGFSGEPVGKAAGGTTSDQPVYTVYYTTDLTKTFTDLEPDTNYAYSASTINESGASTYTPTKLIRTPVLVLDVPGNIRATSTTNSVTISWDPVPKATSYTVNFGAGIRTVTGTTITFSDLKPNTVCNYAVQANNKDGSSEKSPIQYITTKINQESGLPDVKLNQTYLDGRVPYLGLDPVNALTGAFVWSYTYLEDYGKDLLHFTAMYDSRGDYGNVLGNKWTYSFDYRLSMDTEYAYFSTPYGQVVPFHKDLYCTAFEPVEGITSDYEMGWKDDTSFFVRDIDGAEYIFDNTFHLNKIIENGLVTYLFRTDSSGKIISISGQHGAMLTLAYAGGKLSRVSDAMGNEVIFSYQAGNLISAEQPGGKKTSFTYDDHSNLLTITDQAGETSLKNTYDAMGRVTQQNVAGRGDSYAVYDKENAVTIFTDELGNETKYYYDEHLNVTGVELAGISIHNTYNDKGQITEQTDVLGNVTKMGYDSVGRLNHVTYPDGTEESVTYNSKNYPTHVINRDGTEVSYTYDARNNLTALQDERGNTERFTYDQYDNLISYTDKNGNISTYTYDDNNHLETATDPEGNVYEYRYDAIGRLSSVMTPMGRVTVYRYAETGELAYIADADGTIFFTYDPNGNVTGVSDRKGNKQRLEYNEMGLVCLATDYSGNEYRFAYDERGYLVKETDPLGYSVSYNYDALGNLTSWTDQNGNKTEHSFDAAGQVTEVRDAAGNTVKYSYDTMGQVTAVTDARNSRTAYSYDAMGRITDITDALGQKVSYTYDEAGNLLTFTDESGAVTEYIYDALNRITGITDDAGTVSFTYDKSGRLTAVEDAGGYAEKVQYDHEGNITAISDKQNHKTTYEYDRFGRLFKETDARGNTTLYEYDRNGNCVRITDAENNVYAYQYDADDQLTKVTDPLGYEVSYEYDARGNLASYTDERGGKTTFTYDGNGNLIRESSPIGGVKQYSYDVLNRLISIEDENGYTQSLEYDAGGNVTAYVDANQNRWVYAYDALCRLTGVTDQDGGKVAMVYGSTGELKKITDQEGAETTYTYDSLGRLTGMSDALGNSVSYEYDSSGRIIRLTDANANGDNGSKAHTEYEYSPSGDLLSIKDPEGNITLYGYNALGQVLNQTDALGNVTYFAYDPLGQVTSITDALGGQTSFTYTAKGEIATVTDANGAVTSYEYDAAGNLVKLTDALGHSVHYEYDAMNNRIRESAATAEGQICATIYQYDKKGQRIREINPLSDEKVYTYDGNGNLVKIIDEDRYETEISYDLNDSPGSMCYSDGKEAVFRYNKRGELVELTDWNGTVKFEYGKTGNLLKVTDHNGRVTGYGYDANGNTTGITYPDGSKVSYAYDQNNRLTTVTDAENQVTRYEYDPLGNILSIEQPGATTSYDYDANSLPTTVLYELSDGTRMEESRVYDAVGNIVSVEKNGSTPELTGSISYTYDALRQLLSYTDGQITESYTYDPLGNMTARKVNGEQTAAYEYNVFNQLTARTEDGITYNYKYDKRGNQIEEKRSSTLTRQYTYDATNRMVFGQNMETGETSEYVYNGLYMRIKNIQTVRLDGGYQGYGALPETGSGTEGLETEGFGIKEVSYVLDYLSSTNNELMAYEKGFGATRVTYGLESQRLSQQVSLDANAAEQAWTAIAGTSIGKSYFQSDLLGSVVFASNQSGEVLRYAERDAWGDLKIPVYYDLNSAGIERSLLFTNYNYDTVLDKYFAQARFYDPATGRMMSKDPLNTGLNRYKYCRNNPVNYIDPDGELPLPVITGVAEAFIAAVFRAMDYVERQTEAGKKVNPWEVAKAALSGAKNGAIRGAAAGSNPLSALSDMVGIIGNIIVRAAYDKAKTGKVDFFNIAREALYDRYGGRPKPEQPSLAENAAAAVRPATTPSTAPNISSGNPRSGCSGNGSGYGYDYGASNLIKTTPSLGERLKERWSDPTNLINDASIAVSLVGFGVTGIKAISNLMKGGNKFAKAAGKSQGALDLQRSGGKSGSQTKDIYRAVSPEEFDDIFATNSFRGRVDGRSLEVKQFGNNFDEILNLANTHMMRDTAAIVKTTLPTDVYNKLNHMPLDTPYLKSGAVTVEPDMLDFFNKNIIQIKHVY